MARQPVQQNNMEKFPWIQRERYMELMGKLPEEFSEKSEGYKQWKYNPRTKEGREYFSATFSRLQELYADKEQARKSKKEARNKAKRA